MSKLLCGFAASMVVGILLSGCGPSKDGKSQSSSESDGKSNSASEANAKEAEKLFRKMEEKILKCRTLQTEVDVSYVSESSNTKLHGGVAVAPGDKLSIELRTVESDPAKNKVVYLVLSDGTKWYNVGVAPPIGQPKPERLGEMGLASMTRLGVYLGLYDIIHLSVNDQPFKFDMNKYFPVGDFKTGKKETISGVEAQAIEYSFKPPNVSIWRGPISVTTWVDEKTNLPVKRVVTHTQAGKPVTVTEAYSKMVLDEKIDDKRFELMK
jgi:hypothetical protein